jgi:hypothetical protein
MLLVLTLPEGLLLLLPGAAAAGRRCQHAQPHAAAPTRAGRGQPLQQPAAAAALAGARCVPLLCMLLPCTFLQSASARALSAAAAQPRQPKGRSCQQPWQGAGARAEARARPQQTCRTGTQQLLQACAVTVLDCKAQQLVHDIGVVPEAAGEQQDTAGHSTAQRIQQAARLFEGC